MNYSSAALLIAAERRQKVAAADAAYRKAMLAHPELEEAEKRLRKAIITGIDYAVLKEARDKLIVKLGYPPDIFDPKPSCASCGDTGYTGGRFCTCVKQKAAQDTSGENPPPHTFTHADMSVFGKTTAEDSVKSYEVMRKFCEKFPETKNRNILIMGSPGTGKTYLAACVANELLDKGYGAVFVSAFRFNDLCLKYHTSFDGSKGDYLNALTACDLLIIDDLGSESLLKNVTLEYLFTVIDERMRKNRHTLITTNLSPASLEARYSERTASRLFSERFCLPIVMSGGDIRKKK